MQIGARFQDPSYVRNRIAQELEDYRQEQSPFLILQQVKAALEAEGVEVEGAGYYSVSPAARNVLLTEAVNWAAKDIDYNFYSLKPSVFMATAILGANEGVEVYHDEGEEEGYAPVWRMYHPEVGAIGFHDPTGELTKLMAQQSANVVFANPFGFSGISRTEKAFDLLSSAEEVQAMAKATKPTFQSNDTSWQQYVSKDREHQPSETIKRR